MTVLRKVGAVCVGALGMAGLTAFAGLAEGPRFAALDTMQQGLWQMRESGAAPRAVCVRDPTSLFQLRSRGAQCSRFVIENAATTATVHYTCPGIGHGRTTISVETPRLVRIDSEGIENGAPFAIEIEGRRTGDCPAN